MNLKWITAIVIIFGLLAMFYIFSWSTVLKSSLVFSCIVLIGCVLLQAGKGGGLAAIGGLADQSALGTQTGGVLAKVTYLVGAVFIISTLLLTKLTLSSIHGTDTLRREMSTSLQEELSHDHGDHTGHDHSQEVTGGAEGGDSMSMKAVDVSGEEQKSKEN
ncbi:MAG: preprotein translocase subunit SecG [Planctomycetota bacterium]